MKKSVELNTQIRKRVLAFIKRYFREHGKAPTFSEIADAVGIAKSHVRHVVKSLDESKSIRWTPGKARGITLLADAPRTPFIRPQRTERMVPDDIPMPPAHLLKPNAGIVGPANPRSLLPRLASAYAISLAGTIAGGTGVVLFETDSLLGGDQYSLPGSMIPANIDPKSIFALLVKGDSMRDDGIADGDIVFITKTDVWESYDIMAVYIKDEHAATLKRLVQKDRGQIELRPANPAIASRIVSPEEIEVQGRVLAVIKKM